MTILREAVPISFGYSILEAPRWHDGMLYASDFFTHRVLRFEILAGKTEPTTVCVVEGQPAGLGFMPNGALRVVSMQDRQLLEWDGSALSVVADFSALVAGPGNDMAISTDGTCFIGNFGMDADNPSVTAPTSLVRVAPDGSVALVANDVLFPNGIVIDETRGDFFVVETYRGRISRYTYTNGELSNREIWAQLVPDFGDYDVPEVTKKMLMVPDGLAIDRDGALWVGDAKGHRAHRIAPGGEILEIVSTGELTPYGLTLGGASGTTLFLGCAPPTETFNPVIERRGVLMSCEVDVPMP